MTYWVRKEREILENKLVGSNEEITEKSIHKEIFII
jgi:hypothetical protein